MIPPDSEAIVVGSLELRGILHLRSDALVLDYQLYIPEINFIVPGQRLQIPLSAISGLCVRGRWWRPVLELHAQAPSAFGALPLDDRGVVRLRIARADQLHARELAATASLRLAELALAGAPELPPPYPPA